MQVKNISTEPERRPTQTARIVALLRERSPHWVPLPDILELRISQYSARIFQARHEWGLNIENRCENVDGVKHSWFRLIEPKKAPQFVSDESGNGLLFFDQQHRDLG